MHVKWSSQMKTDDLMISTDLVLRRSKKKPFFEYCNLCISVLGPKIKVSFGRI